MVTTSGENRRTMETADAGRRKMETAPRTCGQCGTPLPAGSRRSRKFCSSRCRVRAWDASNPGPNDPERTLVPLHWHFEPYPILIGDGLSPRPTYHYGSGCPPGCTRALEPGWSSTGAIRGEEWRAPKAVH